MKEVTFACEVVTPMFIYGAGSSPELRIPSIKGALRFWWRAMNGHLDPIELRAKEAEFFGGTAEGQGRSKVVLRLKNDIGNNDFGDFEKLVQGNKSSLSYLFYSMKLNKDKTQYIKEKSTFSIIFSSRDDVALKEAIKAFGMLVNFGGLGTRSRRGAGSIAVTSTNLKEVMSDEYLNKLFCLDQVCISKKFKEHVEEVLSEIHPITNAKYSCLNHSTIYIFEPEKDWKTALEIIGNKYKIFRNDKKARCSQTPYFGFPVKHSNGSVFGAVHTDSKSKLERRASPLLFKILKISDECFFPIIIWLKSDLLPEGYEIQKIKDSKKGNQTNQTNQTNDQTNTDQPDAIIKEYIETLPISKKIEHGTT